MQPSSRSPDISAVNPQTTLDPLLVGFLMQRCSSASQPALKRHWIRFWQAFSCSAALLRVNPAPPVVLHSLSLII